MRDRPGQTETIRDASVQRVPDKPIPGLLVLFSEASIPGDGVYPGKARITIGRGLDCTVCLDDSGLSRDHVEVCHKSGKTTVRDLGSHNGTFINGIHASTSAPLGQCDVIRCGRSLFTWALDIRPFSGWRIWGPEPPLVGGPWGSLVAKGGACFCRLIPGAVAAGRKRHRQGGGCPADPPLQRAPGPAGAPPTAPSLRSP